MKTINISNETALKLDQASKKLGISQKEIIKRGIIEYLSKEEVSIKMSANISDELESTFDFYPIGFGMWTNRKDMEDSTIWVRRLREQEWNCS
jgi:hypothetical protein